MVSLNPFAALRRVTVYVSGASKPPVLINVNPSPAEFRTIEPLRLPWCYPSGPHPQAPGSPPGHKD